jgi:type IV secretion system pilin
VLAASNLFTGPCTNGGSSSAVCQDDTSTTNPLIGPGGLLIKVSAIIATLAGVTAIIILIISGLRFMTAAGDPAQVTGAKNGMIGALIGIAVIVLSESIIAFILSKV